MNKSFRLGLSLFVFCVVVFGGFSIIRLFSWKLLVSVDKIFFMFGGLLFVFALFLSFGLSRLDDVPDLPDLDGVPTKNVDVIIKQSQDRELNELRQELVKPSPTVLDSPRPDGILRPPIPRVLSPEDADRLSSDVSMYVDEKRNTNKPVVQQEYNIQEKDVVGGDYENIF